MFFFLYHHNQSHEIDGCRALMAEFSLRDAVVFGSAISPPPKLQQTLFRLLEIRHESEYHLATVSCKL
jgi:hypothetical protein